MSLRQQEALARGRFTAATRRLERACREGAAPKKLGRLVWSAAAAYVNCLYYHFALEGHEVSVETGSGAMRVLARRGEELTAAAVLPTPLLAGLARAPGTPPPALVCACGVGLAEATDFFAQGGDRKLAALGARVWLWVYHAGAGRYVALPAEKMVRAAALARREKVVDMAAARIGRRGKPWPR